MLVLSPFKNTDSIANALRLSRSLSAFPSSVALSFVDPFPQINATVKLTRIDEKTIRTVLAGYKIHNCDVMIREDVCDTISWPSKSK